MNFTFSFWHFRLKAFPAAAEGVENKRTESAGVVTELQLFGHG